VAPFNLRPGAIAPLAPPHDPALDVITNLPIYDIIKYKQCNIDIDIYINYINYNKHYIKLYS